jgi:hypothetical protein
MTSRKRQFNGAGGGATSSSSDSTVTQDDLRKYRALLLEANVEIDNEALRVIAELLRLNVSPDEIYKVLKEILPVCGILKRFKLKPKTSTEQ